MGGNKKCTDDIIACDTGLMSAYGAEEKNTLLKNHWITFNTFERPIYKQFVKSNLYVSLKR